MSSGVPNWTMRPPSMMAMWLPIFSASSRSWLTKMIVLLQLLLQLEQLVLQLGRGSAGRAPRTARPSAGCRRRWRRRGRGRRAAACRRRAHARICRPSASRPTIVELLVDDPVALGLRHAAQLEAEADILGHRAPGQQRELLEHHGDAAACAARAASSASQVATSTTPPPCATSTSPRATLLSPLTARSSVDLPEPERPISTQISPLLDGEVDAGGAKDVAGRGEDLVARPPGVDQRAAASSASVAEDDVDVAELDRDLSPASCAVISRLAAPFRLLEDAVEHDGEEDDGEAGLEAHARC